MIQVMIVDDEMLARAGLRSLIDWNAHGYELVGEADNGQKALELIEQLKPSIVLTDARMPVMDGVELIRECAERGTDTRFIVLSAYGDYDYVRNALKYGAVDYLLKLELEPDGLINALARAAESLPKGEMAETSHLAHRQRYLELLTGCDAKIQQGHIAALRAAGAPCEAFYLIVGALYQDDQPLENEHAAMLGRSLMELLEEIASTYGHAASFYVFRDHTVCTLLQADVLHEALQRMMQRALDTADATLGYRLHMGVSMRTDKLERLGNAYSQALAAMRLSVRTERRFCLSANQLEQEKERHRYITQAKAYVNEHIRQIVTLEQVAEQLSLSPGYLSKLFKAETGERFTHYVQRKKIAAAKTLLNTGDCRVSEVALQLGFDNVTYFSKLFKQITGETPQAYRDKSH